jgi:hypothetical protein
MALRLEVGSKLVEQGAHLPRVLELNSLNFLDCWRVMSCRDRRTFFDQVDASGWHLFFIGGRLNTVSLGTNREDAIRRGVKRLAARVRSDSYNCMEITEISTRRFLGIPYVFIAADMLHIQHGFILDGQDTRKSARLANEWARR